MVDGFVARNFGDEYVDERRLGDLLILVEDGLIVYEIGWCCCIIYVCGVCGVVCGCVYSVDDVFFRVVVDGVLCLCFWCVFLCVVIVSLFVFVIFEDGI